MTALARLDPAVASPAVVRALQRGALAARADAGVIELTGPGALACAQGLLTSDIEAPGDGAFLYGALLTPKGMVVVDAWAARLAETIRLTVPAAGREGALALLTRSVPPRLARVTDASGERAVIRVAGPRAAAVAQDAGFAPPAPGREAGGVAVPPGPAPFGVQITVAAAAADGALERLVRAGAAAADARALELARVAAGWPGLESEVDDKTLPQEIRFDEIGGVSYTKGCYTGQETVSRVHFRGHPNRALRGLLFEDDPPAAAEIRVQADGKDVGRVSSLARVPEGAVRYRWIGLGVLRREVGVGALVDAGGALARVVEPPIALAADEPA